MDLKKSHCSPIDLSQRHKIAFSGFPMLGQVDFLDLTTLSPDLAWDTSLLFSEGNTSVVAIPEPSALALLLVVGSLTLLGTAR
ncbi:MAG: hypothetical protein OHK005_04280 [Candidatus Methylacidiphilales bacterium]